MRYKKYNGEKKNLLYIYIYIDNIVYFRKWYLKHRISLLLVNVIILGTVSFSKCLPTVCHTHKTELLKYYYFLFLLQVVGG